MGEAFKLCSENNAFLNQTLVQIEFVMITWEKKLVVMSIVSDILEIWYILSDIVINQ
jgi:hypothetical protein